MAKTKLKKYKVYSDELDARKKLTKLEIKNIRKIYLQCGSLRKAGKFLNVSSATILRHLKPEKNKQYLEYKKMNPQDKPSNEKQAARQKKWKERKRSLGLWTTRKTGFQGHKLSLKS